MLVRFTLLCTMGQMGDGGYRAPHWSARLGGYGPPCARARGSPRARGPALVLGYRARASLGL